METIEELKLNAEHRASALEPVVRELALLNAKTEEMIQLLCEIIKRQI